MILLPRLSKLAVERLLQATESRRDSQAAPDTSDVVIAATGGQRASRTDIELIHRELRHIAKRCGFEQSGGKSDFASFDALAAAWLAQQPLLATGEGFRDDMWAWMTTVLLRPVVEWRFGDEGKDVSIDRFQGGIRNALQRLWVRGRLLDRGEAAANRWELLHELTEDALVQITERTAVAADQVLALAVAEAWLRASRRNYGVPMEKLMRAVIIRVRIQNLVRLLSTLSSKELEGTLDAMFSEAAKRLALTK